MWRMWNNLRENERQTELYVFYCIVDEKFSFLFYMNFIRLFNDTYKISMYKIQKIMRVNLFIVLTRD